MYLFLIRLSLSNIYFYSCTFWDFHILKFFYVLVSWDFLCTYTLWRFHLLRLWCIYTLWGFSLSIGFDILKPYEIFDVSIPFVGFTFYNFYVPIYSMVFSVHIPFVFWDFLCTCTFWGFFLQKLLVYLYLLWLLIYMYLMRLLSFEIFNVPILFEVFNFWDFWCPYTLWSIVFLRFLKNGDLVNHLVFWNLSCENCVHY